MTRFQIEAMFNAKNDPDAMVLVDEICNSQKPTYHPQSKKTPLYKVFEKHVEKAGSEKRLTRSATVTADVNDSAARQQLAEGIEAICK